MVHTEVVLQCNGGESLGGGFDFYVLFGLDGLMQAVGVTATLHDTTRLFVDDFHFVVDDHIFVVFLEEGVSFEQLVYGVYSLGFDGVFLGDLVFAFLFFDVGETHVVELGQLGADVGKDKKLRVVAIARNHVETFVGKVYPVVFLVDDEVERVGNDGHVTVVFLHVILFCFEHERFDARLAEVFDEGRIFGQSLECAEQQQGAFFANFFVVRGYFYLGIGKQFGSEGFLCFIQRLYFGLQFFKKLYFSFGYGT